ncbi:MAG: 3-oxoacyl-(acyl-carrier-protein) reductase FabG [Spirochaetes bacterium ADurb.Bin315]|jgi:NAD(P)-dependent dehydrogenase (short-subunit alcohol dehydrogenase family)|nr:MAG: 3-oxoacyl-(acyl-carrier-protein) reductase FabG [Spirochaetes bacterium ADurb.Bin315]HOE88528.1 SDR family NAD(P)-dependent oxidoreductase [Sphaerochaeta sp.]HRV24173.1 SDR family NAD(P)-dependent oxidoreductase [Sphaerochaeta sp.]
MKELLAGRVAVVTGSGRGIGAAIARRLAEYGAKVVLTDINTEGIETLEKDLVAKGYEAKSLMFNVADFDNIPKQVERIHALFGSIDIWVNNAGITESASIESITQQQWDRMQDINLKSVFFCSQAVFKIMKEQRYGRLVHISSMAGERGGRGSSASYSASKAGVINLAKSFALNGGQYNITSNAVCPGRTLTEMAKGLSWLTDPKDDPKLTIPLGRFGVPEDIADAVLFLASDLSSYITGIALDVNGGLYMR